MGAQTQGQEVQFQGEVELRNGDYLLQIREKNSKEIDLEVIDNKSFSIYYIYNYKFITSINVATLIAAITKKQEKNLRVVIVPHLSQENESTLQLIVKVSFDFIPPFEEIITLHQKERVSESELIQSQVKIINNDIVAIQKEITTFSLSNQEKFVWVIKKGKYNQQANQILSFKLPKGKYLMKISFFSQSTQNWIYLKINYENQDVFKLQEHGFYYVLGQNFIPHLLEGVLEVNEDVGHMTLDSQLGNSYPWESQNMILTANRI